METAYLKEFVILSDTLSYSKAAAGLGISQSSLSRHIQSMEKELGRPLFSRTTRRMSLSDFGEYFLIYARRAVSAEEELAKAVERWDQEDQNTLEIGCSLYSHLFSMTDNVIAFRRRYPQIEIHTAELPLNELNAAFRSGKLNVITMAYPMEQEVPENMIVTGRGRLCAAVPEDHEFAGYPELPLSRLEGVSVLIPPARNALNTMFRQVCELEGTHPLIVAEGRFEANLKLLEEGMGIAVEARNIAQKHIKTDVALVDLTPRMEFYYGVLYRQKLNRNEELLVRFIRSRSEIQ